MSLVIGTPKATPTLRSVVQALAALGISIDELVLADRQTWGETRFVGRAPDGASASVVVIGRDGADARLASKVWRSILYRDAGPSIAVTRSAQLEHRAYMLLMAAKEGVPVSEVVIATSGGREDTALLVLVDPDGRPLAELEPEQITDVTLDDAWANLDSAARRPPRATASSVPSTCSSLADGTTAFVDFSQGSAGAPEERCVRDQVNLLASTAALVGDDRALEAAVRSLGADGLADLLPMMETAALSPAARRAIAEPKKRLKSLREAGAALAGCEVPELTELRRVSPGSVVMAAATFLGFYLIVAQFAGRRPPRHARRGRVVLGLRGRSPSRSCRSSRDRSPSWGRSTAPCRSGRSSPSSSPTTSPASSAARWPPRRSVIRFFQKQGLKVAVAASSGVMNALAGGIVQIVLVTIGLLTTSTQFVPSSVGGGGIGQIIVIGIIVIGVAITVALLVPKLRAALRQQGRAAGRGRPRQPARGSSPRPARP